MTEMLADILRRLPAKSMVRFRCVSKEWSSLCSDPYFQKLRHQNQLNWKLIARDGRLYSLDLGSLDCALRADYLLQNPKFKVKKVLGCSNGKICLSLYTDRVSEFEYPDRVSKIPPAMFNHDLIMICDLSTGARRNVPPSPVEFQVESLDDVRLRTTPVQWVRRLGIRTALSYGRAMPTADMWRRFSYGFGFDPSGEDYKLVRISQCVLNRWSSPDKNGLLSEAKVYSMKTDSWSRVDQDVSRFHICDNADLDLVEGVFYDKMEPVVVGGVLYWVACGFYLAGQFWLSFRDLIVGFDLAEESFRGLAHERNLDLLCLGSMGGKLFVLGGDPRIVKLWKVEDHGDVWTPLASFGRKLWDSQHSEAMSFSKNGYKVLLENICCDLAKGTAGMCQVKFIPVLATKEDKERIRRENLIRLLCGMKPLVLE